MCKAGALAPPPISNFVFSVGAPSPYKKIVGVVINRPFSTSLRGAKRCGNPHIFCHPQGGVRRKGEQADRRQWRKQGGERMAAVEKIEEKRKPDDFFGHRNKTHCVFFRSKRKKIKVSPGPSPASNSPPDLQAIGQGYFSKKHDITRLIQC